MYLSQGTLKKCTERSLQCGGEPDAASSSCAAVYCQQRLPRNSEPVGQNGGIAVLTVNGVFEVAVKS